MTGRAVLGLVDWRPPTPAADDGAIHVVPVRFALLSGSVMGAVDHNPTRNEPLSRLQNIRAGRVARYSSSEHYPDDAIHRPDNDVDRGARDALTRNRNETSLQSVPCGPWTSTR